MKPKNVGPNYRYKIRNDSGQAREYETYQYPLFLDERYFFMSGMRNTPQEEFKFLRIPADADRTLDGFMIFKDLMINSKQVNLAIKSISEENTAELSQNKDEVTKSFLAIWQSFITGGYNSIASNICLLYTSPSPRDS